MDTRGDNVVAGGSAWLDTTTLGNMANGSNSNLVIRPKTGFVGEESETSAYKG